MSSPSLITIFNDHFIEFIDDIQQIFPLNVDILAAKNSILTIRKLNPSIVIKIWKTYIADVYKTQIDNDDISFFVNKDYSNDLIYSPNSEKIMTAINRLRDPISQMTTGDQVKTMKYLKNLTKLSLLYSAQ
jgi:hypothetical protein